ncbi:BTB/POZ domain-containing protein 2 [Saguinus oedipus]|uniref:BTB/POZ domain-containing protein 2 n=1 Tax=Saguinus oedipus TaxID=9490 RepID=A0ABQ9WAA1_SAGOE|nr:BTB/POZ domain-containing protein 2 [Saguinus oedipus]
MEPTTFLALLKFFYWDEAHCVEFLKKNLNTVDAITAEGFTDIDLETLVAVLERDTLDIREVRLFNAVVRWSEAECPRQQLQVTPENRQKVLGKALGLICFPLKPIEEFTAGPLHSRASWWTVRWSASSCPSPSPQAASGVHGLVRCCLRRKRSIKGFHRWGYSGTSVRIRLSANKRIFMVGFGLCGSIHGPTGYQVNIQIICTDSNTVLGQNDTGVSCQELVKVLPNVSYMACTMLKGPDSHYGTKGLHKVTHESPTTGTKTCFTFCYSAGNNSGISVEDGQIPRSSSTPRLPHTVSLCGDSRVPEVIFYT